MVKAADNPRRWLCWVFPLYKTGRLWLIPFPASLFFSHSALKVPSGPLRWFDNWASLLLSLNTTCQKKTLDWLIHDLDSNTHFQRLSGDTLWKHCKPIIVMLRVQVTCLQDRSRKYQEGPQRGQVQPMRRAPAEFISVNRWELGNCRVVILTP